MIQIITFYFILIHRYFFQPKALYILHTKWFWKARKPSKWKSKRKTLKRDWSTDSLRSLFTLEQSGFFSVYCLKLFYSVAQQKIEICCISNPPLKKQPTRMSLSELYSFHSSSRSRWGTNPSKRENSSQNIKTKKWL